MNKPAAPKDKSQHKFWKTQPVPEYDEVSKVKESGPIEHKMLEDVRKTPYELHKDFKWCEIDLDGPELNELHDLLNQNYVEDIDSTLRFAYSHAFLRWALHPPGWKPEWLLGVRASESNRLVAFIAATPTTLIVRGETIKSVEINFLCIHKKLRSKRLAPLLIKEITRRVNLHDIWQALHTSGTIIPTPVSTCRYYHRPLNWTKLYSVGFSSLPPGSTVAKMEVAYSLPTSIAVEGFRPFAPQDVDQVHQHLNSYLARFDLSIQFSREEIVHFFVPDAEDSDDRVVWSYVIENDSNITEFVSFYKLPSTVLVKDAPDDEVNASYSFYSFSTAAINESEIDRNELQTRLKGLFTAALIESKRKGFDVFNAMSLHDNSLFLEELKFGPGDGFLNYYVFNYRTPKIHGGITDDHELDKNSRSGVGVVML
ncbi:hypothetical protein CANCADRAFT_57947 [Tortispora caseinolytica NRRL Y-17796]|uniref:Glycylpeptide N-tetradecanoyltransferase n=1 Tax=Tortispora caseinolytica NRRL Y-17796 TaxID=767744 RepID=A0A1E4TAV3_9ASCO|nr:hypothetical protein CANCADRAFT_57947 [Tortispora caseinolytica NRRL Y-17796]